MLKIRRPSLLSLTVALTGLEAVISVGYCQTNSERDMSTGQLDNAAPKVSAATTPSAPDVLSAQWETRPDARALNLEIPAPRGQIVDRNGIPFAQTRVCNYLAIRLPAHDVDQLPSDMLEFAREQFDHVNSVLGTDWDTGEERLLAHYKQRRCSPLIFSPALTDSQRRRITPKLTEGLEFFPTYCRIYPQKKSACHIIGYTGRKAAISKKAAISGEPLFPHREGRDGLEASMDEFLSGTPGEIHQLFDESGNKLVEELVRRPVPGNNVVTSLDIGMQKLAENTLSRYCRKGALVVIDIKTGEVLALASRPDYDPNVFVPSITEKEFSKLRDDPAHPMFARAFRGAYPPASTYKVVTALAALGAGVIDEETRIDSPGSMRIAGRKFKNWHSGSEGKIGVQRALARSTNTWFYKIGMKAGADAFSTMSTRLGFGVPTGLPLAAEAGGFVPTHANMQERYGHALRDGYLANASIGQGHVLASPLQVAQMMAAVANGKHLPELRLVNQVQDLDGRVIKDFQPRSRHVLDIDEQSLNLVREGLYDVVNASHGTGKNAANGYHSVAGKTGTGQWGPLDKRQYVAWFAGYVPAHSPKYAFAAIYEGRPGESLTGGKKAAPMIASFFRRHYAGESNSIVTAKLKSLGHKHEPEQLVAKSRKKLSPSPSTSKSASSKTKKVASAPPAPKPKAEKEAKPKRRLFSRIFGKRK